MPWCEEECNHGGTETRLIFFFCCQTTLIKYVAIVQNNKPCLRARPNGFIRAGLLGYLSPALKHISYLQGCPINLRHSSINNLYHFPNFINSMTLKHRSMKFILYTLVLFNVTISKSQTKPYYYTIPDTPKSFTANNVAARMVDGLGFRYFWATEGLTDKDLAYK